MKISLSIVSQALLISGNTPIIQLHCISKVSQLKFSVVSRHLQVENNGLHHKRVNKRLDKTSPATNKHVISKANSLHLVSVSMLPKTNISLVIPMNQGRIRLNCSTSSGGRGTLLKGLSSGKLGTLTSPGPCSG